MRKEMVKVASVKRWANHQTVTELYGLPKTRLYALIAEGAIKTTKIGRQRLFYLPSIDNLLDDDTVT